MYRLSAVEIRDKFLKGETSSVSIIETFLKRIEQYNEEIGAFITVFKNRALNQAKMLDEKKFKGNKLGKLAGIPIAIKDNIHIKGEITTCASHFLKNYKALFDATVVSLLESEDAIIIGKTNLDEFAMGSTCENSALQQTYNPWNKGCSPGGSSGGSAAAVAARLCPISLGSDTGGSIRLPASHCSIVGLKPTYGRVSRYGLVAFGSSLDQIGPLANTLEDIALVMEVLSHKCKHDSTSVSAENNDFVTHLKNDIKGKKIGVPYGIIKNLPDEGRKNFDKALKTFESLGVDCIDIALDSLKYSIAVYYIIATAEASTNLARFDGIKYGQRSQKAKTLDEVYEYSKAEGFGDEVKRRILLGTYVLSAGYQDAYYRKAQKVRALMIEEFAKSFEKCDIIAMPVTLSPAPAIGAIQNPLEMYMSDLFTISSNLAGLPAISVPSGFSEDGKPMGLQLIGPQMQDDRLCNFAYAFEQITKYNKIPPGFME